MNDIFISYSSEDRQKAKVIAELLIQEGFIVWWDRNIPAGKSYDEVIEAELNNSKLIIVLWSSKSILSTWVKAESDIALKKDTLFPILIENVKIPIPFNRVQTVDLTNWNFKGRSKLADEFKSEIAKKFDRIVSTSPPKIKLLSRVSSKAIIIAGLIIIALIVSIYFLTNQKPASGNSKINVRVDAQNENGTPTGIDVTPGDTLKASSSGVWGWGCSWGPECQCGPEGIDFMPAEPCPFSNQNLGLLIGKINNYYFTIGIGTTFVSNQKGQLYLMMNDRFGSYKDNWGSVDAIVSY